MTRTDRSRGMPDYVPLALRRERPDDRLDAKRKAIQSRKEKFEALNTFVTEDGGWVVSIPGEPLVTIECTERSNLPEKLRDLGYELHEVDRRERMISNATTKEFATSCHRKIRTLSHAGLVPVIAYSFEL
ncbi:MULTISPECIES: hypothetical protein [unclassified Bradyrhizobium]|uniref:hypothetical protein n=1 Tax=unclassified Bradyrhizobium TaxID=2631580 RepID=UPI0028E5259D|nr:MULTISPECIES: hypothetical protein [unclassified Bradyrhizobium]